MSEQFSTMYERYKDVKTGEDLKRMGVVPKAASAHLALIALRRMRALRQHSLESVTEETLGTWRPALVQQKGKLSLAPDTVADSRLGHRVRLAKPYIGTMSVDDRQGYGTSNNIRFELPEGTVATLTAYEQRSNNVDIKLDRPVPGQGNRLNFTLRANQAIDALQVSSLGQIEPKDLETAVKEEVLLRFFPSTVLEDDRAKFAIIALLMGKDIIFYGPPGAGKTQISRDIQALFAQQSVLFHPEDCQVQCNPYSVFDAEFSKVVPPCPECMIKYSANGNDFRETGVFIPPDPSDVRVVVSMLREGNGIEHLLGKRSLDSDALIGFKIPRLDGTTDDRRESEYDPEGYHPGALLRTNNGLLRIEEIGRMRPEVLDTLLDVLSENSAKPEQLRWEYPTDSVIIGTTNDNTMTSAAISDRMVELAIRHPANPDTRGHIRRRSYHKEHVSLEETPIGDTHTEQPIRLRDATVPAIMEAAVDAFMAKFDHEYHGEGRQEIHTSNRTLHDALDATRAYRIFASVFHDSTPPIPTVEHVIRGLQYALCTRVKEKTREKDIAAKKALIAYVREQYPTLLQQEENTWWCRAKRVAETQAAVIPGIDEKWHAELDRYSAEPASALPAFRSVREARAHPADKGLQLALLDHPFMAYLFKEQPDGFAVLNDDQVTSMVGFYMRSWASTDVGKERQAAR